MTDRLVVTTTLAAFVLDLEPGIARQILIGQGVYYGVTFGADRCYVAARFASYGSERPIQDNAIICLDRAARVVGTLRAPEPIRDVHQIAWHAGQLYIVSTYDDCVVIYDTERDRWDRWLPFDAERGAPPNQHHINSLHVTDDRILLAGNKPSGWYACFDRHRRLLGGGRVALGRGTHNIWPEPGGGVGVCSSLEGALRSTAGYANTIHPRAWLRGIARLGDDTLVGVSQNRVRDTRKSTDCSVVRLDAAGRPVDYWTFEGFGMVHDLRALGVADAWYHNDAVFSFDSSALARLPTVHQTGRELVDLNKP